MDQQTAPPASVGRSWSYTIYPNLTVLSYYPETGQCTVDPGAVGGLQADPGWLPGNWTQFLGYEKWAVVNGINCSTYYQFRNEGFLALSARYAVSPDGIPVSLTYGLGDGPHPPFAPTLQADVFSFQPGVQASEDVYRWPSYCQSVASVVRSNEEIHSFASQRAVSLRGVTLDS